MNNRHLLIHIGGFKTATTTLQRTLYAVRDVLAEHRVIYPEFASNHGLALYPILKGTYKTLARHPYGGLWTGTAAARANDKIAKTFKDELSHIDDDTLTILSGEHFCALDTRSVAQFAENLRTKFTNITAVMSLRAPISFSTSMTQQLVRDGAPLTPVLENPILPQYRACIEPWDAALGKDALRFITYDPARNPIEAFFTAIKRPDLIDTAKSMTDHLSTNTSASFAAIKMLDHINTLHPGGLTNPERGVRVSKMAERIKGVRFALDTDTAQRVKSRSQDDLTWLQERVNEDLFADEPIPNSSAQELDFSSINNTDEWPELKRVNDPIQMAEQLNTLALRQQNTDGECFFDEALSNDDEDLGWKGIALLTDEKRLLDACSKSSDQGWGELAQYAATQALQISPESPQALMTYGQLKACAS